MEFRILGPLEVLDRGRLVPLGGGKQRTLLAILLINSNQVMPANRLIDLLWGEQPPETTNNVLQVYISQFRKVLEPEHRRGTPYQVLMSQPAGYQLRVGAGRLDADRFEALFEKGRLALAGHDPLTAATALRNALDMWRGPALTDVGRESFALAEIARLTEMRLQAVEERIEADLALGGHADVMSELHALVAEHPLRERLCGQLMLALYQSGRQAEAYARGARRPAGDGTRPKAPTVAQTDPQPGSRPGRWAASRPRGPLEPARQSHHIHWP